MKEYIRLLKIKLSGCNSIEYEYEVSSSLKHFFNDYPYTLSYELNDAPLDISGVPEGVLAVPFICNVLPVCWLCDAVLQVNEIDSDFLSSVPEFKKGYIEMFPDASFRGKIEAERVTVSSPSVSGRSALFYSGGLDSSCTLARHYDEKPYLISIWGSDIPADNAEGWNVLHRTIAEDIKALGLDSIVIRSTFRKIINVGELGRNFSPVLKGDNWWHGVQHGIAIIAHAAPCNFILGVTSQYIAASYSPEHTAPSCASDPTIDNYVRFAGCQVYHDAYISRQEKVRELVKFCNERKINIHLHVCWKSVDGKNCQMCEKCCRTIMGILTENADPNDYGFSLSKKNLDKCRCLCVYAIEYGQNSIPFWKQIQDRFSENKSNLINSKNYKYVSWLDNFDFDRCNKYPIRRLIALLKNKFRGKVGNFLRRLILKK